MSIQEGKKAPSFTAVDQGGEKLKLADFKGKKNCSLFLSKR